MIVSVTRASSSGNVGFLDRRHVLNVMLTRCRGCVYFFADLRGRSPLVD